MSVAFRGRVRADAFVLDPALLGEAEARRRVAEHWSPGSALLRLPGGAWLLRLGAPVEIRAELSPGLPLAVTAGSVAYPYHGQTVLCGLSELEPVEPAWADLAELRHIRLSTLDAPRGEPLPLEWLAPLPLDLRSLVGLPPPTADLSAHPRRRWFLWRRPAREAKSQARTAGGWWDKPLTGMLWLPLGVAGFFAALISDPRLLLVIPVLLLGVVLLALLIAAVTPSSAKAPQPAAGAQPARRWWWPRFRRQLVRSALGGLLWSGRRRRLELVISELEAGRWLEGLRDAPPLNASQPGTSLGRRLADAYRSAVARLEAERQGELAAYVHTVLLGNPQAAVALLPRYGRYALAAEIAQAHGLDPATAVRLWWQAGEHEKALDQARLAEARWKVTRGWPGYAAMASAVRHLSSMDSSSGTALLGRWTQALLEAGDRLDAVRLAWPEPELRPLVEPALAEGAALGGRAEGELLAYAVEADPGLAGQALELLRDRDPWRRQAQRHFVLAWARLSTSDTALDRRLCTSALRAVIRFELRADEQEHDEWREALRLLRGRADRLAVADLPELPKGSEPAFTERITAPPVALPSAGLPRSIGLARANSESAQVTAAQSPAAQATVAAAVALPAGGLLVAQGEAGLSLRGLDGKIRQFWDAPVDRILPTSHGGRLLLAQTLPQGCVLYRFDLASRVLTRVGALAEQPFTPGLDSSIAAQIGRPTAGAPAGGSGAAGGSAEVELTFVDLSGPAPRILSREWGRPDLSRSSEDLRVSHVDFPGGEARGALSYEGMTTVWDGQGRVVVVDSAGRLLAAVAFT